MFVSLAGGVGPRVDEEGLDEGEGGAEAGGMGGKHDENMGENDEEREGSLGIGIGNKAESEV